MSSRKIDYKITQKLRMLDFHHNYDYRICTYNSIDNNPYKIEFINNNCIQVQWYNERNHAKDD